MAVEASATPRPLPAKSSMRASEFLEVYLRWVRPVRTGREQRRGDGRRVRASSCRAPLLLLQLALLDVLEHELNSVLTAAHLLGVLLLVAATLADLPPLQRHEPVGVLARLLQQQSNLVRSLHGRLGAGRAAGQQLLALSEPFPYILDASGNLLFETEKLVAAVRRRRCRIGAIASL